MDFHLLGMVWGISNKLLDDVDAAGRTTFEEKNFLTNLF